MHNKTIHMWVTLWVVGSTEVHNVGHVCGALRYLLWIIWVTFVGHLGHFCKAMWVTFVGHVGKCRGSFGSPVRVTWVISLGRLGQVCKSVGSRLWGKVHSPSVRPPGRRRALITGIAKICLSLYGWEDLVGLMQ